MYLFVHIDQAGAVDSRQRRRSWVGAEDAAVWGSHSSDHRPLALWPGVGREL